MKSMKQSGTWRKPLSSFVQRRSGCRSPGSIRPHARSLTKPGVTGNHLIHGKPLRY
ncbi:hypothetical protein CIB84_001224 [Bambusicola thoracicus]|uniref:Uncharacterized protein n=1 Tax=Bambusicola thoracicus TaxID=9083 RepID=A0A2P4TFA2_BAMTH|nr:hypothetical protein CIB84_001224 [Bambusicola thoracicus]